MCAGDLSLEKASVDESGRRLTGVNGWDTAHTCSNWQDIFAFVGLHRTNEEYGIF